MSDKHTLSFAIIGTGAIGGYYGGLLARTGYPTHFLARSDAQYMQQHGLTVRSPKGDFHLTNIAVYQNSSDLPDCDVVCVCLKTTHNDILQRLLPQITTPETAIVLIQNGLGEEEKIAKILPENPILGCMAFICSNKSKPGIIEHLDYGHVILAPYSACSANSALEAIKAAFQDAGISTTIEPDLMLARWKKLMWNIPYNGLSVLLNATTDRIMADPDSRSLINELMREVQSGAKACGCPIEDSFLEKMLSNTQKMTPYKTSMMLDYASGSPMELESMFAAPLRYAQAKGTSLPRIETLYKALMFKDKGS